MAIKAVVSILMLVTLLQGCALPQLSDRSQSTAIPVTQARQTTLGKAWAAHESANPDKSGIYPVQYSRDAFASRIALVRAAQRTIDIQTYIWRNDVTGQLLINELLHAANRGVRIRLLLDDNGISGLENVLNWLDQHPNVEVRLFNPFAIRNPKWLGYLVDFPRVNRRMHNKAFVVDNQVAISGGRNIGDEYFGANESTLFEDLDVLCVGTVVRAVSRDFDLYWQSESAYPSSVVLIPSEPHAIKVVESELAIVGESERAAVYLSQVRDAQFLRNLIDGTLPVQWVTVRMVSDKPGKVLDKAQREDLLVKELRQFIDQPHISFNVVSPYFVPSERGVEFFSQLASQGVNVQVLTNSLEATDVAAVHSGYAKSRVDLLKAGVRLFELKATKDDAGQGREAEGFMLGGSRSSLHTKAFSVDGTRVFVGSFNFDPRSINLNTEMGFLIQSLSLAAQIDDAFQAMPARAYEVRLGENDALVWIERQAGKEIVHNLEPKATLWRRVMVFFYSLLPIRDLL